MAIFDSQIIASASGSVGGLTLLHSRGGLTLRARAVPVNPRKPAQDVVRGLLRYLANYWIENLSIKQRARWDTYAANTPRPNALGHHINVGGLAMWIRSQLPRVQAGLSFSKNAPTQYRTGSFTPVVGVTVASIAQRLIITFDNNDAWARAAGSAMLMFIGRPQNQTINRHRGSYRYSGRLDGNPLFPPTSPANFPVPFRVEIGHKVFFRVAVTLSDGRYTHSQVASATVT